MSLLNTFREIFDRVVIAPTKAHVDSEGRLFSPTGQFVQQYSRKRDAIRGAKRRGWEVTVG